MGYRIKTVAEMLGIPRNTLLAWERRYNIVQPARQANGYREYSDDDVTRLRELKRLIDDGHRVSEAISLMQEAQVAAHSPDAQASADLVEALLDALLRLDRRAADEILRRSTLPFARIIDEIFFPLQRHVGELWEEDALNSAQEHIISHFVRERMLNMLTALDYGPASGRLTLCSAFPDEEHDIALLGIAVKLAMRNHRIIYVGQRTEVGALIQLIQSSAPELVCVSVTIPRPREEVIAVAEQLSAATEGRRTQVTFGGRGLPAEALPKLPRVTWARSSRALIR